MHDGGVCFRAQFSCVDVFPQHARGGQLVDICAPQVEHGPALRSRREPPLQRRNGMPGFLKGLDHLLPHFTAAGPQTGADSRNQVPGIGPELALHRAHGFRDDRLHGAAPARVHSADGRAFPVGEQYRRAIGYPHADGHVRVVADDRVGLRRLPRRGRPISRCRDRGAVHLANQSQRSG